MMPITLAWNKLNEGTQLPQGVKSLSCLNYYLLRPAQFADTAAPWLQAVSAACMSVAYALLLSIDCHLLPWRQIGPWIP